MRAAIFGVALTSLALVLAATATGSPQSRAVRWVRQGDQPREGRAASLATDNPRFRRGGWRAKKPGSSEPGERQGYYLSRVRFEKQSALRRDLSPVRPCRFTTRSTARRRSLLHAQVSFNKQRRGNVRLELVLLREQAVGRNAGTPTRASERWPARPYNSARRSARRARYIITSPPSQSAAVYDSNNDAISRSTQARSTHVVDLPTSSSWSPSSSTRRDVVIFRARALEQFGISAKGEHLRALKRA